MAKLVVFYSRADENYFGGTCRYVAEGNTEIVARMVAAATGAELFRLEQAEPYAADYQTCISQAKRDLQAKARPALKSLPAMDAYDEIYLGYPNYWGDMPMAVYTFLEAFSWTGKTIHPFCTHEGSGLSGTEQKLRQACGGGVVKNGLSIRGSEARRAAPAVKRWVE